MFICNFVKGQGLLKMPDGTWKGKVMHVEWHGYCGPMLMTKDWRQDAKRQPNENSKFWDLMNKWKSAGFAIDDYGYCLDKDNTPLSA